MPYKKVRLFLSFMILVFLSLASNAHVDSLFGKGNSLYQQMKYDSALSIYKQLTHQGVSSSVLYYNVGNAYYKIRQFDSAKLYYQKSLKLHASHKGCQHNLALCRNKLNIKLGNGDMLLFKSGLLINSFSINQLSIVIYSFIFLMSMFFVFRTNQYKVELMNKALKYSTWILAFLCTYSVLIWMFNRFVHWM